MQKNADKIKEAVLGKRYELSLVFIDSKFSRRLNRIYRKKDRPTNILSFPLSKTSGEIFIDLVQAKKEFKKFDLTFSQFITFLFIHGLLHLKGMTHGSTMEKAERKFHKKFKHVSLNFSWH
ncbi:MAG: rRNA maturation RNase YbeY [Minisyncoccota bacterium]